MRQLHLKMIAVPCHSLLILLHAVIVVKGIFIVPNQPPFNPYLYVKEIPTATFDKFGPTQYSNVLPPYQLPLAEYDFIIVGSGPAGCVLANRLSAISHWQVLLIEAGAEETLAHQIPLFAANLQSTASNWNYVTERQNGTCLAMDNQQCAFPRGKALGGTSTINYMIYNRGNRRDFDQWAKDGNYGWSYDEVLPYFKKSESAQLKRYNNSFYHGYSGGLSVEDVRHRTKIAKSYLKATKESGYQIIDYNGETQSGSGYLQANTRKGVRHSAASAFLSPIRQRPNLHILLNTRVVRVLIDQHTKTAIGVDIHRNKQQYTIHTRKEVILSAGTFGSAQLLMLSGVGPHDHLQSLGIPVLQNLPVGQTMYDHFSHFGPTFIVNTTRESPNIRTLGINDLKQFIAGTGKGTLPGGVEALTFIKFPQSSDAKDWPDSEIVFAVGSMGADEGTAIRRGLRVRQDVYDRVFKPLENENIDTWTAFVMQFRPKSVGYMRLADANPYHWPKFYTNWLTNPYDEEVLLHGIKETIRISKAPAMQKIGARLHDIPITGCEHLHFGSDAYWRCSIRHMGSSLHHQVGTCKMGPPADKSTVVSPELRVHGIHNLRVADCSIVPRPLTGHTNAVSFMIGEKLSDMLLAVHRVK